MKIEDFKCIYKKQLMWPTFKTGSLRPPSPGIFLRFYEK